MITSSAKENDTPPHWNMDVQRLRNLTTGRLHTTMTDIYQDIASLTGEQGLMSHHIPAAFDALTPWLRMRVTLPKFWDGTYDPTQTGTYPIAPMTARWGLSMKHDTITPYHFHRIGVF
jgi:hypothetical protein